MNVNHALGSPNALFLLAITEDDLESNVARGKDAGRRLTHEAVARSRRILGAAAIGLGNME